MSHSRSAPTRRLPDDDALAFELAAAARPHLSRVDADGIYIAFGVGDTFTAINALITAIARNRIAVRNGLVAAVAAWLDCYRGQDAEPRLRCAGDWPAAHDLGEHLSVKVTSLPGTAPGRANP